MDKLLNPDTGLIIWTIVTFLCLVFILKKAAWGPLLHSIEEREARMRAEREGAEAARAGAEKIKAELEAQLSGAQSQARDLIARATKDAEVLKSKLRADAEADAQRIREKTQAELAEDAERLKRELRKEVAGLTVMAAEKLMRKTMDDNVQKTVLEGFFKDLESQKGKTN